MGTIGSCRCCGQTKMIEVTEDLQKDLPDLTMRFENADTEKEKEAAADDIATVTCKCKEGKDLREYRRKIKAGADSIEAMFRESYPDIADALQELKEYIISGNIAKVTLMDGMTGGTASMFMKKERLKIRWKKNIEMEIEA